ncbi:hypothetical protein [Treponema sp. R80B11-R83G3]
MPQNQTMTLDEKLAISNKAFTLLDAGDREGAMRLMKTAPIPPYIAKVIKEKAGAEYLAGWNLSDAEAEFGQGWLNK